MTPGPIRAHRDAFRALITAALPNHQLVDGVWGTAEQAPPAQTPPATPYMVLRVGSAPLTSDRLAPFSNVLALRLNLTCVGATQDEALWLVEHTRTVLLDQRITVAGWNTGPLQLADTQPVRPDTDVDPPLMVAVDVYGLTSTSTGG